MICPECKQKANKISGTNNWYCYQCQHEILGIDLKLKAGAHALAAESKKKAKFNNVKSKIDGITFDSQLEARFYNELKLRLKAGDIAGYCYKSKFLLTPETQAQRKSEYITDFIIFNNDGTYEIIDTKGIRTKEYILKIKQMAVNYPLLKVKEVTR